MKLKSGCFMQTIIQILNRRKSMLLKALFFFILLNISYISYATPFIDSLLNRLDEAMEKQDVYLNQKWDKIKALNGILAEKNRFEDTYYRYSIYSKLFDEYKSFNYDSSFVYARKMVDIAYKIKNSEIIDDAKINMAFVLLSSGFFHESVDTLLSIDVNKLPQILKIKYFQTLNRVWIDLADYTQDAFYGPIYNDKGNDALLKAISLCDSNSADYPFLNGLYCLRVYNLPKARGYYEQMLASSNFSLHEKAILASSLSYIYRHTNQPGKSIEQLVNAAIFDIQSATKETVALTNLAETLYSMGYTDFALKCVQQALNDANFYGARHRKVQISNILPIIEGTLLKSKERESKAFMLYSLVLTIAVVLLLILTYITIRQNQNLKRTKAQLDQTIVNLENSNKQLKEVNRIKEEYIGHFFNVISNYIEKLEKMKKSIGRKISMNKLADIDAIIQHIDLEKEREDLFASFDSIFMMLFPRFVAYYNSHVSPEDQVNIEQGMPFTPELRIFALKRLGINDAEKIAKFLGYSVTTIYTYKTKLKKRSMSSGTNIEDVLMNIEME